ncbi:ABC transporter permease [Rhodoferax sp.]|uniref:ABC transporter permease n=1 Tax=Rhodoferax sp. TaxID=50421 RepID=UPI00374DCA75
MTTAENLLSAAPVLRAVARRQGRAATAVAKGAAPAYALWWTGVVAAVAWAALGLLTALWPNKPVGFSEWAYTAEFAWFAGLVAASLLVLGFTASDTAKVRTAGPWLIALALGLAVWEVVTAKLGSLPPPFFAPPQSLAEVFISDWRRLLDSVAHSLQLLGLGIGIGAAVGFLVGVCIGWSRRANYWVHPILRVLGPLPTTALLPISFYFFPSSWSTAIFLIALGTAFPVAILSASGVASVNKNFYDVARTMGASPWFLVLRVAIPAALPQVFVGLFMGLGHAFATLVVAEMLGVKAGLGWYLTWAQGWAAYPNMYAALLVMALLFSGLISLLFVLRDRVLSWQKGMLKW